MPNPNDLKKYLDSVNAPNEVKGAAWDAASNATSSDDFQKRMQNVSLPNNVKADLWEGSFGKGFPQAPAVAPQPVPQAQTPQPSAMDRLRHGLGEAWDWANKPINALGIRSNVEALDQYANSDTLRSDADWVAAHPSLSKYLPAPGQAKKLVAGTAADALKMIGTPLAVATAGAGAAVESAAQLPKVARAAKIVGAVTGAGFAGQGAYDLATHGVSRQPDETEDQYEHRVAGDIGMVAAPALHYVAGRLGARVAKAAAATPVSPEVTPEQAPVADARYNRAMGQQNGPAMPLPKAEPVGPEVIPPEAQQPQASPRPKTATLDALSTNPSETSQPTQPSPVSAPANATPEVAEPHARGVADAPQVEPTLTQPPPTEGFEPGPEAAPVVPSPDQTSLEEEMRPLIGKVMRLKQLQRGERASSLIDDAITISHMDDGRLLPSQKDTLSKILGGDVGDKLTDAQQTALEKRRGGQVGKNAAPRFYDNDNHAMLRRHVDANGLEDLRTQSIQNLMRDLNDPDIPEERKAKLQKMADGNYGDKVPLYLPDMKYPKPEPLPADHPEAPFTSSKFGNDITPHSTANVEAALGQRPRDLLFSKSNAPGHLLTDSEKSYLEELNQRRKGNMPEAAPAPEPERPVRTTSRRDAPDVADRPLPDAGVEAAASLYGLDPEKLKGKGYSLNDLKAMSPGLTPQSSMSMVGPDAIRAVTGDLSTEEDGQRTGPSTVKADYSKEEKAYQDEKRRLAGVALDRYTKLQEQALKSKAAKWLATNPADSELKRQLSRLAPERRADLPKELFRDGKQTNRLSRSTASVKSASLLAREGQSSAPTTSATDALIGTGTDPLKAKANLRALKQEFPSELPNVDAMADVIHSADGKEFTPNAKKRMFANAVDVYLRALRNGDDYALKKAFDAINRGPITDPTAKLNASVFGADLAVKGAADAVGKVIDAVKGPEDNPGLADQNRRISISVLEARFKRYEGMDEISRATYREHILAEENRRHLEGSKPTDPNSPEQAAQHQALQDRYDNLVDSVGPSRSVSINGWNLFERWSRKPAEGLTPGLVKESSQRRLGAGSDLAMGGSEDQAKPLSQREQVGNVKRIVRATEGPMMRDLGIVKEAMSAADKVMEGMSEPDRLKFMAAIEKGVYTDDSITPETKAAWEQTQGLPPLQKFADLIRNGLDSARERVHQSNGSFEYYMKNYMPHIWSNVGNAEAYMRSWWDHTAGRGNSMEGNTDFLKQREYESIVDGLKAGLQLKTTNPVRLALARIEQLHRFAMAHDIFNQLKNSPDTGTRFFEQGESLPAGYVRLDDRIFNKGEEGKSGAYYAPKEVARILNNFTSQGLRGKWTVPYTDLSLYDAMRGFGNLANQFQLSVSFFHGVETSFNSILTANSVGLQTIINERNLAKGLTQMMKSPVAWLEDFRDGRHAIMNYKNPHQFADYESTSQAIEKANGRVEVDSEFRLHSLEKMRENWKTAVNTYRTPQERARAGFKAASNIVGAALEATSYPIMQKWVPALKIGAFRREALQTMSEYAGQPDEILQDQLQKKWDSVDNRFGEVVYNNLFMHQITRDIMGTTMRSPGWNIGTVREGTGGVMDLAKSIKDTAQNKEPFKISTRTAYVASMVAATMMFNGLWTFMHTGETPHDKDYFFGRDGTTDPEGKPNRVYPKLYTYDYISLYHAPLDTAFHKATPTIGTVTDLVRNKNFFGREIRDPGDSALGQAKSVLGYLAGNSFTPFTVSNFKESAMRGSGNNLASAFAVLPAPKWVNESNAESLAHQYYDMKHPQGGQTDSEIEKKQQFVVMRNAYRQGKITDDDLQKAVEDGKITAKQLRYFVQTTKPALERHFEGLSDWKQTQAVWNAASPEERSKLAKVYLKRAITNTEPDSQEQSHALQQAEDALNHK